MLLDVLFRLCAELFKLVQKSHIVLIQVTHVVNVILKHYYSLNAHAECKAAVFIGIDSAAFQHIRMNHSRTENFYPTFSFTKPAAFTAASEA